MRTSSGSTSPGTGMSIAKLGPAESTSLAIVIVVRRPSRTSTTWLARLVSVSPALPT
jgi:hypothetical protein